MQSSTKLLVRLSGMLVLSLALAGAGCGPRTDDGGDEDPNTFSKGGSNSDAGSSSSDSNSGSNGTGGGTVPGGSSDANLSDSDGSGGYKGPTSGMSDAECKQYFSNEFAQNDHLMSIKTQEDVNSNDPRDYICDEGEKCAVHNLHFRMDGAYTQTFTIDEEFNTLDPEETPPPGYCHDGTYEVTGCNEIQFETCDGDRYQGSWLVYEFPTEDRRLLILTAPFRVKDQVLEYTALFEEIAQPDYLNIGSWCIEHKDCSG